MEKMKYREVEHGGDWSGFYAEHGYMPLDFSANVSPLGMPESARSAAEKLLASGNEISAYPDPACRTLRYAIADKYDISADQIFCANGAADIIYRLVLAVRPSKALLVAPDFGEYAEALRMTGTETAYYTAFRERVFSLTDDILSYINNNTDLVILSSPNNPSGYAAAPDLLSRILDRCRKVGALFVIDECFLDFLPDAAERTMLKHISGSEGHLLVLRAFTKFYGMAGIRLGWCASGNAELLRNLMRVGPPWQVSAIAQAAGIAALSDISYEEDLRTLIARERAYLCEGLKSRGYYVTDSAANYILFHSEDPALHKRLAGQGIMIRNCGSYTGLTEGWYRIAVRTRRENEILLSHL